MEYLLYENEHKTEGQAKFILLFSILSPIENNFHELNLSHCFSSGESNLLSLDWDIGIGLEILALDSVIESVS